MQEFDTLLDAINKYNKDEITLFNLRKIASEPLNVKKPMPMINSDNISMCRCVPSSATPINPELSPPKPFKIATICGRFCICIFCALMIPINPPNIMAKMTGIMCIVETVKRLRSIANIMAIIAQILLRYAFLGSDNPLMAYINNG